MAASTIRVSRLDDLTSPRNPHRRNISEPISVAYGPFDVPMCHGSHGSEDGYDRLKDLELAAKNELTGHMYRNEGFARKNAFVGKVAPDNDVEEFLLECDLYDSDACRWRDIPEKPLHESDLSLLAKCLRQPLTTSTLF